MKMVPLEASPYNRAARVTAAAFGIMIGVAGIEHGFFEVLQGNVRLDSLLFEAIGPAQRFWEYGTERALTIVPSTLISGILAMLIGVLMTIWAAALVQRRFGALVLFICGIALFLLGGGFAPIFLTILAGATAAAIHRSLGIWRRILFAPLRRLLSKLWPGTLAALVVTFVVAVEIAIFGYPLLWLFKADTTLAILNILSYIMVGLMLLSVLTAIAFDVERRIMASSRE
jgi:hypothetical protein